MMMALELSYLSSHFFSFLCVFWSACFPSSSLNGWARMECFCFYGGLSLRVAPFCGGVCSFGVFLLFAASAPRPSSASSVASVPSGGRHALSVSSFAASAPSGGRHASSPSSVYLQGAGTRRCFFFCGVFASSVAASVSFPSGSRHASSVSSFAASAPSGGRHAASSVASVPSGGRHSWRLRLRVAGTHRRLWQHLFLQGQARVKCFFFCGSFAASAPSGGRHASSASSVTQTFFCDSDTHRVFCLSVASFARKVARIECCRRPRRLFPQSVTPRLRKGQAL